MTITYDNSSGIQKIKWDWASSSAGAVSEQTAQYYNGQIMRVVLSPDSATTTQPTDAYDVTILDSDGYDVLGGLGANLTNAATVYKTQGDGLGCVQSTQLTLTVANAGDTKGGIVVLYLIPIQQKW